MIDILMTALSKNEEIYYRCVYTQEREGGQVNAQRGQLLDTSTWLYEFAHLIFITKNEEEEEKRWRRVKTRSTHHHFPSKQKKSEWGVDHLFYIREREKNKPPLSNLHSPRKTWRRPLPKSEGKIWINIHLFKKLMEADDGGEKEKKTRKIFFLFFQKDTRKYYITTYI